MSNEPKAFNGTLTNFGVAPYQHDPNNSQSYFVDIKQPNGNDRTIWAMGLREHIEKGGFKVGDQVNLIDLGVPEGSRRKEWQVDRYEPSFDKNSIEADFTPEKQKQAIQDPTNDYDKLKSNFDLDELPSFVKNNYIGMPVNRFLKDEKVNYYDKADQSSVAFEDRRNALHTSRQDEKTIKAMLDLAQSKGWSSIKLKGTEEFKREAWLEASIRGIETKGYTPTEKDLADLKIRQELRTNNQVEVDKQRSPTITATQEKMVSTETSDLEKSSKPQEKQGFLDSIKSKVFTKGAGSTQADPLKNTNVDVATGDNLTVGAETLAKGVVMDKVVDTMDIDKPGHQQNVDNSLAIKKEWYESRNFIKNFSSSYKDGKTSEALSKDYHEISYDKDIYLRGQLKKDISSAERKYHHGIDKSSDSIFIKSTLKDVLQHHVDTEVLNQAINKFNNRFDEIVKQRDGFENFDLRSMAVLTRHDLKNVLETNNVKNTNDLIKQFDDRVIDYSKQVINLQKDVFQSNNKEVSTKQIDGEEELSKHFDNIGKYDLNENQLFAIEVWRRKVENDYKDHPDFVARKLNDLNEKIPDIASGKFVLPMSPDIKIPPSIEVATHDKASQDRVR